LIKERNPLLADISREIATLRSQWQTRATHMRNR
jgi:hypothetical protein